MSERKFDVNESLKKLKANMEEGDFIVFIPLIMEAILKERKRFAIECLEAVRPGIKDCKFPKDSHLRIGWNAHGLRMFGKIDAKIKAVEEGV